MNRITELLDLEDSDIVVSDIRVEGRQKTLTLETPPAVHNCPQCGFRMHSRGIEKAPDFTSHPAGRIRTVPAVKTASLAMH